MGEDEQNRVIGALTDIQRRSLEAAGALVDRLVSTVDGARAGSGDESDPPAAAGPVEELVDGWSKLWRDSVASLAGAVGAPGPGAAAAFEVGATGRPTPARLEVRDEGDAVEVWVHNPTERPVEALRVHCGRLRSTEGKELDDDAVQLDPPEFDLPARSSRGVRISVGWMPPPGTYRTVLLVDGLPDQWLPLEVVVPPTEAGS